MGSPNTYSKKGEYEKAIKYYKKSVRLAEKIGDKSGLSGSYLFLGKHYIKTKNYYQADLFLSEALAISINIGDKHTQMSVYKELSILDSINNDFLSAYQNYKKYSTIKDSIFQKENTKQITEIQAKFDMERQEKENFLLKEQQVKNEMIMRQKTECFF